MALFDLLDCVGVVVAGVCWVSLAFGLFFFPMMMMMGGKGSEAYDVTGISPQSRTLAQLLKGFVSSGTLYPPLKRTFREPFVPAYNGKRVVVSRGRTTS